MVGEQCRVSGGGRAAAVSVAATAAVLVLLLAVATMTAVDGVGGGRLWLVVVGGGRCMLDYPPK